VAASCTLKPVNENQKTLQPGEDIPLVLAVSLEKSVRLTMIAISRSQFFWTPF